MKGKIQTLLTVLFAVAILISGMAKSAGSQSNLVLASVDYVDAKFNELSLRISTLQPGSSTGGTPTVDPNVATRLTDAERKIRTAENTIDQLSLKMDFVDHLIRDISEGAMYQVIKLNPGDKLLASATSEFVLRSGNAKAIGNVHNEGLSNVTNGAEIKNSQAIPRNHLVIIPRGDGRGIIAETECYVMFKGIWYMN